MLGMARDSSLAGIACMLGMAGDSSLAWTVPKTLGIQDQGPIVGKHVLHTPLTKQPLP
jgi:hypothetical protein